MANSGLGRAGSGAGEMRPIWLPLTVLLSAGCGAILSSDFSKARKVAEFRLGESSALHATLRLPPGQAQVIIAVPNYRCNMPDVTAAVSIRIHIGDTELVREQVKLSDVVWAYANNSCDAYGYTYNEMSQLTNTFNIPSSKSDADVDVAIDSKGKVMPAAVWVVYQGRVPTAKVFAPQGRQ
jgi:hypothetical protein